MREPKSPGNRGVGNFKLKTPREADLDIFDPAYHIEEDDVPDVVD